MINMNRAAEKIEMGTQHLHLKEYSNNETDFGEEENECHLLQRNNSFRQKGKCQHGSPLPLLKDDKKGA